MFLVRAKMSLSIAACSSVRSVGNLFHALDVACDIPVLKIISLLVIIKYGGNHLCISWVWVSELISVLVSI